MKPFLSATLLCRIMKVGIKPYLIDREGKLPRRYDKIGCLTDLLTII